MKLGRTEGRIVCHLPAGGPIAPSAPSPVREFATAKAPRKARPKAPDVTHVRPIPGHGCGPFGGNPYAIFDCLGLGTWRDFAWRRLIDGYRAALSSGAYALA